MEIKDFLLAELAREARRTRAVLQHIPGGKTDWKPHEKSMQFGYLADLVATMPTWIAMQLELDELDIAPEGGGQGTPKLRETRDELLHALDDGVAKAGAALERTSDDHLRTNWRLMARGQLAQEAPRDEMIQDTFNHWSHHRGQLTVYLRLLGAPVASTYGPSADEQTFR